MNRLAKLAGGGGSALVGIGALIYGVNVSAFIVSFLYPGSAQAFQHL